ncbi:hypothetical protein Trydic_g7171, partial [Trypoxylus dichotomus]
MPSPTRESKGDERRRKKRRRTAEEDGDGSCEAATVLMLAYTSPL